MLDDIWESITDAFGSIGELFAWDSEVFGNIKFWVSFVASYGALFYVLGFWEGMPNRNVYYIVGFFASFILSYFFVMKENNQ